MTSPPIQRCHRNRRQSPDIRQPFFLLYSGVYSRIRRTPLFLAYLNQMNLNFIIIRNPVRRSRQNRLCLNRLPGIMPSLGVDEAIAVTRVHSVAGLLPARPRDSSKGRFGSVVIVGGARGMAGAALLAARGAQASGAGKVSIISPDDPVFDPGQPQLMSRPASAGFGPAKVLVTGCGLGTGPESCKLFEQAVGQALAQVLDADALNLLSMQTLPTGPRHAPTVLTPHPLEAARLLGTDVAAIQADRIASAREIARRWDALTVLKGAGTVIAAADGRWAILESGGPALASAGSGDVLAGVIGGLMAQSLGAWDAAVLGCWAHAAAADTWSSASRWPAGLSAAALPDLVRSALSSLA
jgi:hydroxyethylthiazole kinase-like uncharacterized protein yjeF